MSELATIPAEETTWPKGETRTGWLGRDISPDRLSWDLSAGEIETLRGLVAKTRHMPMTEVTREAFSAPALEARLTALVRELKRGVGLVFVRGIPVESFTHDEVRRLFWGLGTHFGAPLSQSRAGDKMGDVTPRPGTGRGYTSDQELALHTDSSEIISLLCLQQAKSGGENVMVSSLALWEIVARERPEFIPILKRGFRLWRINEHSAGSEPITPYHVPIFGERDGLRSVWQGWQLADATAQYLNEPLTDDQQAAIAFILEVLERPELHFTARLQAGEAMFWNNYEILHSRKAFVQWEDPKKTRHLLRLWMQADPPRPLAEEQIVWRNRSGLQGHDPEPKSDEAGFTKRGTDPLSAFMTNYFADFYKVEKVEVTT